MKYIVDIHNTQNTASLQNFLQDKIDLSNNFFPGIDKSIGGKVQTYYTKAPYMLSANTAWLVPNTTHEPLNDAASGVHSRCRSTSTGSSGRLRPHRLEGEPDGPPADLEQVIDQVQANKLGFKYSVSGAKALLAENGYKDAKATATSGTRRLAINLRLIVPNGWSDWMTAIQIIADSAKDAGIKITPSYPDYNRLVVDAELRQVRPRDHQRQAARHAEQVLRLHVPSPGGGSRPRTTRDSPRRAQAVGADARAEQRQPLERGGRRRCTRRSRSSSSRIFPRSRSGTTECGRRPTRPYWKNFPRSTARHYTPTWNGYLNMTGIDAIANLKAAK